jgi:hypothetical protein
MESNKLRVIGATSCRARDVGWTRRRLGRTVGRTKPARGPSCRPPCRSGGEPWLTFRRRTLSSCEPLVRTASQRVIASSKATSWTPTTPQLCGPTRSQRARSCRIPGTLTPTRPVTRSSSLARSTRHRPTWPRIGSRLLKPGRIFPPSWTGVPRSRPPRFTAERSSRASGDRRSGR